MKIDKGSKEVINTVGNFILYVIAPIYFSGLYFNEPLFNGISEYHAWFLITLFIAGVADAFKDTLQFHFSTSVFKNLSPQYWDPSVSWKSKYIDGDPAKGLRKWWFIPIPVIFTDGFHLFKGMHTLFITMSVVLFQSTYGCLPLDILAAYCFYKIGFNSFYNVILKSRQ